MLAAARPRKEEPRAGTFGLHPKRMMRHVAGPLTVGGAQVLATNRTRRPER
jgi:hypothetical protein